MERNDECEDETIVYYANYIAPQLDPLVGFDDAEVDSVISHESSVDHAHYIEESSEQSNESSNPTVPEHLSHFKELGDYLTYRRNDPKLIADLHAQKSTSQQLGNLVAAINEPGAAQFLQDYCNIIEYNNELLGVFIQPSVKEFKQNFGFDEANFPFADSGGPQRTKEHEFGYTFKYWTGKQDKSYKMRKFYVENGYALIVVFQEPISPAGSPSSNAEIKADPAPANKKPRVGNSPFKSSEHTSAVSSPSGQTTSYGSNANYSNSGAPTNYSQHVGQQHVVATTGPLNNGGTNNTPQNPVLSPEHLSNRITSLSQSVDELASRVTTLEIRPASGQPVIALTDEQRRLCGLIIRVLRENGGRHKLGKPLATKVRKLVGGTLETSVVNNLLYKVLGALGIAELQDTEWVLIDEEKAKQFSDQQ